jgi:hypothetical protein
MVFPVGVNPDPLIVTEVPTEPDDGKRPFIETWGEGV